MKVPYIAVHRNKFLPQSFANKTGVSCSDAELERLHVIVSELQVMIPKYLVYCVCCCKAFEMLLTKPVYSLADRYRMKLVLIKDLGSHKEALSCIIYTEEIHLKVGKLTV